MIRQPTAVDLAAAREVATVVRERGGELTATVDELLASFGTTRLTVAARDRIDQALSAAGVTTSPSIKEARRGEQITLATRVARARVLRYLRVRSLPGIGDQSSSG